ncbi:N-acetylneuraminate lyase-like [Cylas formicarius]|uniref:N-acetylneuraminate lyase-like n=1 Tax=Cylas formicarius TaxID=197179 RepID=UPI0029586CD1|nr:N-acetylneuraminate lyase-like [Cylas formicarius]
MASFNFRGLIAPVFTAFNNDLSINTNVIPKYAKFLLDSGINGVLVHGTTGEGVSLSVEEREKVTEAWLQAVKQTKQHLMVQVGGCPLPDAIRLAKHAESIGADSLLCLPELYFKPTNPQELIDYLKNIGQAAPKTPLLYYHIPAWSNVNVNMEDFLNQVGNQIPSFKGIKYTSNDLSAGYDATKAAGGKFAVFLGADSLMAGAFTQGFDSSIATSLNILPQFGVQILKAVQSSKLEEARKLQDKLTAACKVITKNGAWVPTMKAAMNSLTPINVGPARPPLKNLTSDQIKELETSIKPFL